MIGSLLYVTASSLHVCKISILTKKKLFEGYKENIELLEAYTKFWFVVSQRSKVLASWLL